MRTRRLAFAASLTLLSGCAHGSGTTGDGPASGASEPTAAEAEQATPARAPEARPATEQRGPLAWISDDYEGALAEASRRNVPLFVDLWAPWCHTCLSMKQTVFVDPGLAPVADRFVWLELDADRPENAAALEALPPTAMPTFYVVSPVDRSIQARLTGSATVDQIRSLLAHGEQGHRAAQGDDLSPNDPAYHLREADRAVAEGRRAEADAAYAAALQAAPAGWPRRPDVLVSRISNLYAMEDWSGCLALASERLDAVAEPPSASAADFAYYAHACAEHLQGDPRVEPLRRRLVDPQGPVRAVVDDPDAPLSADDRSDALRILREIHLSLGEDGAARSLAERQRAVIDAAWAAAPDAHARMLWGWPRSEVYTFLGRPEALVPDLEALVADLPGEYDPPYRLAWVLLQAGQPDPAAEMAARAADLAYGPRRARALQLLAAAHAARGDVAAQRAALAEVVAVYEGLPEGQRRPEALAEARRALEALD